MGILFSLVLLLVVRRWESTEVENAAAELVHEQLEELQVTLLRSTEVLHSVAALHAARGRVTPEEFYPFVAAALARQPELQAISWNPVVAAAARDRFERTVRAEGRASFSITERGPGTNLVMAGERPEYVPVEWIAPLRGNEAAVGFDLSSDPSRRQSIDVARKTARTVATAPVRLTQGSVLGRQDVGILVLLPVYAAGEDQVEPARSRVPAGYAVAVFRVGDLVRRAMSRLEQKGITAALYDGSEKGELIFSNGALGRAQNRTWVEVASRRWAVTYAPGARFLASHPRVQSWWVLLVGLTLTLITTAHFESAHRRTQEVRAANNALREEVRVRQRAEAAAQAANEAKSDFLARMSHEVRTPLNAILGYAQLMRRDPELEEQHREAIEAMNANGQHLLGLVNEVLDLAKIEAGRMELEPVAFDLRAVGRNLASTFKPLCAQKRIGYRVEVLEPAATHASVLGDEGKLRQVLINLIANAVKFTRAGEVHVRFQRRRPEAWTFEVIDTGLGIPLEEQPHIFEPFHQGKSQHQGGTGLGLAIAQRQVVLLGGQLTFESERGVGSRFCFTIPLPAAEAIVSQEPLDVSDHVGGSSSAWLAASECGPILLPESLSARLFVAAELHSTTALKAAVEDLRQLGPDARQLADQLRAHMRSFDMEGVQRLLTHKVVTASDSSAPAHAQAVRPA